tara:strand:+ start:3865 stop:6414 length:2550 start_codon:yes stop_codon:yes gene_type:complete
MATVFMPDNDGRVLHRPNVFVRLDKKTAKGVRSSLVASAIVEDIHLAMNEEYSTCRLLLPNARFGDHINYGSRVEVFKDNMANKIFDGRIVKEISSLETDTVRVILYDAKWLLNNNTIIGTYDAKWNSNKYPKANKITGIKTVANVSEAGTSNWNNLSFKTIFNEGGIGDRSFEVFQSGAKPVPLFDKRSPHKGLREIEKEDSDILKDNPYYPQMWRYGDIIAYLIFFHSEDFDIRLSNKNYNMLNNIESPNRTNTTNAKNEKNKPRDLDLNNLPFVQAIGKIFRTIGPRYSFDISTHEKSNAIFYQLNVTDLRDTTKRSVKIAKDNSTVGETGDVRTNVFRSNISRDASNIITSLRGVGRKIEIEMTIALEPAWDIQELQAQYPDITLNDVQEIFFERHINGNKFDDPSTTWDGEANNVGTGRLITPASDNITFFEVYHQYRDWFDKKYLKQWKLPSDKNKYQNTLTDDFAYRGLRLDQMFTTDEDGKYRKFRNPETPLRTTNYLSGDLDSKLEKYKQPVVFTYDSGTGVAECVPFKLAYKYGRDDGETGPILTNFKTGGIEKKTGGIFSGGFIVSPSVNFSVKDNTITFSQHMYRRFTGTTGNNTIDKFINDRENVIGNTPTVAQFVGQTDFGEAQMIFMTAVVDTDLKLTPNIENTSFNDFDVAGIKVNRYLEDDAYRVVIRDHSVLLNLQYYLKDGENIKASEKSKERAGNLQLKVEDNTNTLQVKLNNGGRFEEYSDGDASEAEGGSGGANITNISPFIDDYDDFLDHIYERLDTKSRFKENMTFALENFDTSYKVGEKIADVLNSDKEGGPGFLGSDAIITSIDMAVNNQFTVTLNASDILAD